MCSPPVPQHNWRDETKRANERWNERNDEEENLKGAFSDEANEGVKTRLLPRLALSTHSDRGLVD